MHAKLTTSKDFQHFCAASLLALALLLGALGCGGGSSTTTNASSSSRAAVTPAGPTKAEFLTKANAICEASNASLAAVTVKLASHPSPAQAAQIVTGTFLPLVKKQFGEIQALGTPVGGEAAVARMQRLLRADVKKIEADPALAGPAAFHNFATVAHSFGLTSCAPLS
jgi:hypothetical protein